jgi:hypothetical protein
MDVILFVITFVLLIVGKLMRSDLREREIVGVVSLSVAQKWPGKSRFGRKGGLRLSFQRSGHRTLHANDAVPGRLWVKCPARGAYDVRDGFGAQSLFQAQSG